jgi:hypothetical protein
MLLELKEAESASKYKERIFGAPTHADFEEHEAVEWSVENGKAYRGMPFFRFLAREKDASHIAPQRQTQLSRYREPDL